jgi:hypothetical protein
MSKKSMFWNWIRWQCLNQKDWDEQPAGTTIDEDHFLVQLITIGYSAYRHKRTEAEIERRRELRKM